MRLYRQGDDAAQVDWKRSARGNRLYSRERADSSQTQALVVIDASRSMGVGHRPGQPAKFELARVTAAALVTLLVEQGDTVGLYASTAPPVWLAPAGGAHHAQVLVEALASLDARSDVVPARAVTQALAHLRRPSLVAVLSDGWDDGDYLDALRHAAASGHDVAVFTLTSTGDLRLPVHGIVELEDAETGEVRTVEASALGPSYADAAAAHYAALERGLRGSRLSGVGLTTDAPLVPQLRRFLTARAAARG